MGTGAILCPVNGLEGWNPGENVDHPQLELFTIPGLTGNEW